MDLSEIKHDIHHKVFVIGQDQAGGKFRVWGKFLIEAISFNKDGSYKYELTTISRKGPDRVFSKYAEALAECERLNHRR